MERSLAWDLITNFVGTGTTGGLKKHMTMPTLLLIVTVGGNLLFGMNHETVYSCTVKTTMHKNNNDMNANNKHLALMAVAVLAMVSLLPFLGLAEFNSKGEPREAVVAVSMLNDGNWILPVNNGGDIPYKPPFFHFCIALFSLVSGHVTEFTSRLPSALSLVAMVVGCFAFFRKRKDTAVAALAAMFTLTSFEAHRAGMNCRVDMMLTAFVVGTLLLLYRWHERGGRGVPLWAILCMSGAVMTKGPVGFVLPCLVTGVYMLVRGERFWRAFGLMALFGLLSCVLPAMWYVAAYGQGGERFLELVIEENFGRMTGTMSYESHVHPFTYNFMTIISGWLPWTLLAAFSLFVLPWRRYKWRFGCRAMIAKLRSADPLQTFVWLCVVIVFVFYCLPSSKRSVYLLPCYPFMAYLMGEYVLWLVGSGRVRVVRAYALFVAALGVVLTGVFLAVKDGMVPDTIFTGKHAAENIAMLRALRELDMTPWRTVLVWLPVAAAIFSVLVFAMRQLRRHRHAVISAAFAPVFSMFLALDGVYQPTVLNTKSLRPMADTIKKMFPGSELYSYISAPMMHFFGANFYLGDKIGQFEQPYYSASGGAWRTPDKGILVIPDSDSEEFVKRHPDYKFIRVLRSTGRPSEVKDRISFYRFSRLSTK